jgi:heat shock protein HslJ
MRVSPMIAGLAVIALIAAGCGTTSGPTSGAAYELSGTRWVVTEIDGRTPLVGAVLTADFGTDGRINGDSGCNSYSGPFIQNGRTVQFGELLSTRRACLDPERQRQRQETRLLNILQGSTTLRTSRRQLSLRSAGGTVVLTREDRVALDYSR